MKKDTKGKKIALIAILSVLLVCSVVFAVGLMGGKDSSNKEQGNKVTDKIEGTNTNNSNQSTDGNNGTSINTDDTTDVDDTDNAVFADDGESFTIKTSYGDLYFPKMWEENIKTKVRKKDGIETVEFSVKIKGKKEIHVFDVVFGGDNYELGCIKISEDEKIAVSVTSYTYELNKSWTDDEKLKLAAIEYDINYVIDNLDKIKGFEKW